VDPRREGRRIRTGVIRRRDALWVRSLDAVARVRRRRPGGPVALTFDDGPMPGSTDRLLDVLGELGVAATFFCVGRNAAAHPELVARMRAEGHAVGSHSLTHPHPRDIALPALAREYVAGRRAVERAATGPVSLFRPPHGYVTPARAVLMRSLGLRTWLWSVDPEDWVPGVERDAIVAVASRAGPGDVVVMHDWVEQPEKDDALDRTATITAVPAIVANLRARGLTLTALPA
jgi:peptidoglycan/xylan/chitin deacetylase (PgdA/CDA1 family)